MPFLSPNQQILYTRAKYIADVQQNSVKALLGKYVHKEMYMQWLW